MREYIALIHKDSDSDFGVSFPDFPGCVTAGEDLDEARQMAKDALALHVEGLIEDGDVLPEPSSLQAVMADAENRGAVAFLVPVADRAPKSVRVNITMSEALLEAVDKFAADKGYSRSGFLAMAAKKAMSA